jgi:hypothetical protein
VDENLVLCDSHLKASHLLCLGFHGFGSFRHLGTSWEIAHFMILSVVIGMPGGRRQSWPRGFWHRFVRCSSDTAHRTHRLRRPFTTHLPSFLHPANIRRRDDRLVEPTQVAGPLSSSFASGLAQRRISSYPSVIKTINGIQTTNRWR